MVAVLHVTQPTEAGVGVYVAALAADQRARGWDVAVACPDGGPLTGDLATAGVPRLAWPAERAIGANVVGEVARLNRLLADVQPDVVHLHSSKAGLAGRLALRGRRPTIFQPHGWSWLAAPPRLTKATIAWERSAARWTTLYVCVCEAEAAQAGEHRLHGTYQVIHSGVDLHRFRLGTERTRSTVRPRLRLPPLAPLVVCVGRVTRQKGQDLLLAAWPRVLARCPDATLALVGSADSRSAMPEAVPDGVVVAGPTDDTWPWYVAADVVVLPSRWEGMPLTLLEALAVGRPVVGTDIPAIAESLPTGCGTVVPLGDLGALADAITFRIRRPEVARAEGAAGARYAAEEADVRRTHDELASVTARVARRRY